MSLNRLTPSTPAPLSPLDAHELTATTGPAGSAALPFASGAGDAIEAPVGLSAVPFFADASPHAPDASGARTTTAGDLLADRGVFAVVNGLAPSSPSRAREHQATTLPWSAGTRDVPSEWQFTKLGKGLAEYVPFLRNALDADRGAYYEPLRQAVGSYNTALDRETREVDAALAKDLKNGSLARLNHRSDGKVFTTLQAYDRARADVENARHGLNRAESELVAAEQDLVGVESEVEAAALSGERGQEEKRKAELERKKGFAGQAGAVVGSATVERKEGYKQGAAAVGEFAAGLYFDRKIAEVDERIARLDERIASVTDDGLRARLEASRARLQAAKEGFAEASGKFESARMTVRAHAGALAEMEQRLDCGGTFFRKAYAAHERIDAESDRLAGAAEAWDARLGSAPYWQAHGFHGMAKLAGGGDDAVMFTTTLGRQAAWQNGHRANNSRIIEDVSQGGQFFMIDQAMAGAERQLGPRGVR